MILRLPNTKVSQPILPNKYDDFLDELLQVKQALHSAVVLDFFTTTVNTEKENEPGRVTKLKGREISCTF